VKQAKQRLIDSLRGALDRQVLEYQRLDECFKECTREKLDLEVALQVCAGVCCVAIRRPSPRPTIHHPSSAILLFPSHAAV
jgi:hypothetical protein